jgi:general secretion pathway protein J
MLTWRATAQMIDTQTRVSTEIERWRSIARAVHQIELEILQIAAPALPATSTVSPALALLRSADGGDSELRLIALGGEGEGARRVGFRFSHARLEWLIWPDREALGEPEIFPLLNHVAAVRWHFIADDVRNDQWPLEGAKGDVLPSAIELELDLPDAGTITRLFALR